MSSSSDRSDHSHSRTLSARTIHDLHVSLTIIKAQAQMLRRWVLRSGVTESSAVVARLDMIETRVSQVVSDLEEPSPVSRPDPVVDAAGPERDATMRDRSRR